MKIWGDILARNRYRKKYRKKKNRSEEVTDTPLQKDGGQAEEASDTEDSEAAEEITAGEDAEVSEEITAGEDTRKSEEASDTEGAETFEESAADEDPEGSADPGDFEEDVAEEDIEEAGDFEGSEEEYYEDEEYYDEEEYYDDEEYSEDATEDYYEDEDGYDPEADPEDEAGYETLEDADDPGYAEEYEDAEDGEGSGYAEETDDAGDGDDPGYAEDYEEAAETEEAGYEEVVEEDEIELVYDDGRDVKKKKKHKESHRLKYTILLIPSNNRTIKQFSLSFDFIIFVTLLVAVVILLLSILVVREATFTQNLRDTIGEQMDTINEQEDEKIVLMGRIEELENTLRDAKVTIDANKTLQQQAAEKETEASIPSAMPLGSSTTIPEFQDGEGKQYIQFTTGYGTKVLATADGTITMCTESEEYGYIVKVDHGNGYESEYMMKCSPQISLGDKVTRGTTIYSADDDNLILTYRVYFNGDRINPMDTIKIDG